MSMDSRVVGTRWLDSEGWVLVPSLVCLTVLRWDCVVEDVGAGNSRQGREAMYVPSALWSSAAWTCGSIWSSVAGGSLCSAMSRSGRGPEASSVRRRDRRWVRSSMTGPKTLARSLELFFLRRLDRRPRAMPKWWAKWTRRARRN